VQSYKHHIIQNFVETIFWIKFELQIKAFANVVDKFRLLLLEAVIVLQNVACKENSKILTFNYK